MMQQVLSTDRLPSLDKNYQSINFEIRPNKKPNVYQHQMSQAVSLASS